MDKTYMRMVYPYTMNPLELLFPKVRGEMLRLLFTDPGRRLHLREISRLSGLAVGTIQGEVARLRSAGLLIELRDGNRLYFQANQEHPLFPELRGITLKTTGLQSQVQKSLEGLDGVDFAFVYGSFASGTARSDSDIDLMVIGSTGLRQIVPRLKTVANTLGREINPHVLTLESFRSKHSGGDAYITRVLDEPKIWIIGTDHELAGLV
ncbi:MAG: nucleotidyltransferase domain-containing protein [Opitutales bacterium]|nr:nucleotidyltransferase domain-containing protein [Opitutales bacterium]